MSLQQVHGSEDQASSSREDRRGAQAGAVRSIGLRVARVAIFAYAALSVGGPLLAWASSLKDPYLWQAISVLSLVALACIALAPIAGMRVLAACTIAAHLVGYALPDGAWSWSHITILLILPRVLEGWIVLRIASAVDGRAARALATASIAAVALAGILFCVLAIVPLALELRPYYGGYEIIVARTGAALLFRSRVTEICGNVSLVPLAIAFILIGIALPGLDVTQEAHAVKPSAMLSGWSSSFAPVRSKGGAAPRPPAYVAGAILAFRNEITILSAFALVFLQVIATTLGDVWEVLYALALILVRIVIWIVRARRGMLFKPMFRTFKAWILEYLIVFIVCFAALAVAEALVGALPRRDWAPARGIDFAIVVDTILRMVKETAQRGPTITFLRSFEASVSSFTARESAPTLAGFGKLQIVNDDVVGELHRYPMFGIETLVMVPIQEQQFFNNTVWKRGVERFLAESDIVVFDVTSFSPGLAWELETYAPRAGQRTLFIARNGRPAPGFEAFTARFGGASRFLGGLSSPIPYSSDPAGVIAFRIIVIRWMASVASRPRRRRRRG